MILYIFNCFTCKFERYTLDPYDSIPYSTHNSISMGDFTIGSRSLIAWTTLDTILLCNKLYSASDEKPHPLSGFVRICEGKHPPQSNHYCGTALDFPSQTKLPSITSISQTIHSDSSLHVTPDTNNAYGYPKLEYGDTGVHVFVLQDALFTLGFTPCALDGFYGKETKEALVSFQKFCSLDINGIADSETWRFLTYHASGVGPLNKIPYLL